MARGAAPLPSAVSHPAPRRPARRSATGSATSPALLTGPQSRVSRPVARSWAVVSCPDSSQQRRAGAGRAGDHQDAVAHTPGAGPRPGRRRRARAARTSGLARARPRRRAALLRGGRSAHPGRAAWRPRRRWTIACGAAEGTAGRARGQFDRARREVARRVAGVREAVGLDAAEGAASASATTRSGGGQIAAERGPGGRRGRRESRRSGRAGRSSGRGSRRRGPASSPERRRGRPRRTPPPGCARSPRCRSRARAGTAPVATAIAEPPLEPPGLRPASRGSLAPGVSAPEAELVRARLADDDRAGLRSLATIAASGRRHPGLASGRARSAGRRRRSGP